MTQVPTTYWAILGTIIFGAVTAIGFFGRWFLKHLDKKDGCLDNITKELAAERDERTKMTEGFLGSLNYQNQLICNHLTHMEDEFKQQQAELRRLIDAIDRLCTRVDKLG